MNAYSIGVLYELKAARYLRRQGCRVIARRYRAADGEIDLIARDGDTLAFICPYSPTFSSRRSRRRCSWSWC